VTGGDGATLREALARAGLHGAGLIAFLAWLALIHPTLEELCWRGMLLTRERHPAGRDAAFAAYHVPVIAIYGGVLMAALAFAVLVFVAWLWRTVAIRSGGLAAPILGHLVANTSVALAIWLMAR
jgi:membrane protease YdiL (CAAX protease family)